MSVRITGDLLALDKRVKREINRQAAAIHESFPGRDYQIQARIAEEFDQLHGHRVRLELVVTAPERQQVVVREAQKKAEEAIRAAFANLKLQLRRIGRRRSRKIGSAGALTASGV